MSSKFFDVVLNCSLKAVAVYRFHVVVVALRNYICPAAIFSARFNVPSTQDIVIASLNIPVNAKQHALGQAIKSSLPRVHVLFRQPFRRSTRDPVHIRFRYRYHRRRCGFGDIQRRNALLLALYAQQPCSSGANLGVPYAIQRDTQLTFIPLRSWRSHIFYCWQQD